MFVKIIKITIGTALTLFGLLCGWIGFKTLLDTGKFTGGSELLIPGIFMVGIGLQLLLPKKQIKKNDN